MAENNDAATVERERLRLPAKMDLRDWLAGQALKALIGRYVGETANVACQRVPLCEDAYLIADEMLAARAQGAPRG
jgi:hypothetical protein